VCSKSNNSFFGSIPEPEPEYEEVVYAWLPLWAYSYEEIDEIKNNCVRYTKDTYTLLQEKITRTSYFDN